MALKTEKYRKYYLKCSNTFLVGCNYKKVDNFARAILSSNAGCIVEINAPCSYACLMFEQIHVHYMVTNHLLAPLLWSHLQLMSNIFFFCLMDFTSIFSNFWIIFSRPIAVNNLFSYTSISRISAELLVHSHSSSKKSFSAEYDPSFRESWQTC